MGPRPNPPLVTVKAGLVEREGNLMKPDPRKGTIQVFQTLEPSRMRFVWSEIGSGNAAAAELDFEIQIGETNVFKLGSPNAEEDARVCGRVNSLVRDAPAPAMGGLMSMDMDMGMGGGPSALNALTAESLQNLIGQISGGGGGEGVDLLQVLSADAVDPVLNSLMAEDSGGESESESRLRELLDELPGDLQSMYELRTTFRSPQFQQSVQMLAAALRSGQLMNIAVQCGLDTARMSPYGGVKEFLKALIEQAKSKAREHQEQTQRREGDDPGRYSDSRDRV